MNKNPFKVIMFLFIVKVFVLGFVQSELISVVCSVMGREDCLPKLELTYPNFLSWQSCLLNYYFISNLHLVFFPFGFVGLFFIFADVLLFICSNFLSEISLTFESMKVLSYNLSLICDCQKQVTQSKFINSC